MEKMEVIDLISDSEEETNASSRSNTGKGKRRVCVYFFYIVFTNARFSKDADELGSEKEVVVVVLDQSTKSENERSKSVRIVLWEAFADYTFALVFFEAVGLFFLFSWTRSHVIWRRSLNRSITRLRSLRHRFKYRN